MAKPIGATVEFFDVRNKVAFEKPLAEVQKKAFANGRHAMVGTTEDGRRVYRFCSQADYDAAKCPLFSE